MKDKSLHPQKSQIVDSIEGIEPKGLVRTEEKLFYDTVKQLLAQFRNNFDSSRDGGDQKKREDQFIDFAYQRLASQLSEVEIEGLDCEALINKCFDGFEVQDQATEQAKETIEQVVKKFVENKQKTKNKTTSKNKSTDTSIEISTDTDELLKVFDDLLGKNKNFEALNKRQKDQNQDFRNKILSAFKENLLKYAQKSQQEQPSQTNETTPVDQNHSLGGQTVGQNTKSEEEQKKTTTQEELDEIMKKIDPTRFKKKGRRGFKNKRYRTLIDKYLAEHKPQEVERPSAVPKAFNTITQLNQTLGTEKTNSEQKKQEQTPQTSIKGLKKGEPQSDRETIEAADELASKYYNKAKKMWLWSKMSKFFAFGKKVFGKLIMPFKWIFRPIKALGIGLKKVGKMLLDITKIILKNTFDYLLKTMLLTPAGMYTLGFMVGIVCHWVKHKLGLDKYLAGDENTPIGKLFNGLKYFFDYIITPLWDIVKVLFDIAIKTLNVVFNFIKQHPTLSALIGTLLLSLREISGIKTTINIARMCKGGMVNGLIGVGASMATESIFEGMFKSKSEDTAGQHMHLISGTEYMEIPEYNSHTIKMLGNEQAQKFLFISEMMDKEVMDIEIASRDISNIRNLYVDHGDENEKKRKISDLLGDPFIRRVYFSHLFNFDHDEYNKFYSEHVSKDLDGQLTALTEYLAKRMQDVVLMKTTFVSASHQKNGKDILNKLLNRTVEANQNGEGFSMRRSTAGMSFAVSTRKKQYGDFGGREEIGHVFGREGDPSIHRNRFGDTNYNDVEHWKYGKAARIIIESQFGDKMASRPSVMQKMVGNKDLFAFDPYHDERYGRDGGPEDQTKAEEVAHAVGEEKIKHTIDNMDQADRDIAAAIPDELIEKHLKGITTQGDVDQVLYKLVSEERNRITEEEAKKHKEEYERYLTSIDTTISVLTDQREGLQRDVSQLRMQKGVK